MSDTVTIDRHKLVAIQNTLRLVIQVNNCADKSACFDREVVTAKDWVDDALKQSSSQQ